MPLEEVLDPRRLLVKLDEEVDEVRKPACITAVTSGAVNKLWFIVERSGLAFKICKYFPVTVLGLSQLHMQQSLTN